MTLEVNIQTTGVRWLRDQGCDVYKLGQDGVPDYLVIYAPGRHFWLELKTPTGGFTKAQQKRIPHMRRRGHEVFVCTTQDEIRSVLITVRGRK